MKRILSGVLAFLLLFSLPVQAGVVEAVSKRLRDSAGTLLTDFAIANGATVYSESVPVADNSGYMAVFVIEDKSGGGGDLAISAEYSVDGTNFYPGYTTSSGSLTLDSNIVTNLTNDTRYIQITPRLAKFIRFKFVAAAASELTMDLIWARTR